MQKEKVRVYALARELNMESKDLLDMCRDAGLDLKNQLSSLDPDQQEMIVQLVKRGGHAPVSSTASTSIAAAPVLPPVHKKTVRTLPARPKHGAEPVRPSPVTSQTPGSKPSLPPVAREIPIVPTSPEEEVVEEITLPPQPELEKVAVNEAGVSPESLIEEVGSKEAPHIPASITTPAELTTMAEAVTTSTEPSDPAIVSDGHEATPPMLPSEYSTPSPTIAGTSPKTPTTPTEKKIRDLGGSKTTKETRGRPQPRMSRPAPTNFIPAPPPKKSLLPKETKKPLQEKKQTPIQRFSKEMLEKAREKVIRPEDILEPKSKTTLLIEEEEEETTGRGKEKKKKAGIGDRQQRKQAREKRAQERRLQGQLTLDDTTLDEDRGIKTRTKGEKKPKAPVLAPAKPTKIVVEFPITVRALSEALGMKSVQLLFKLRDHGLPPNININSTIEPAIAEEIAIDVGLELEVKRPPDAEDILIESLNQNDNPEELVPRAPIVTVMGHVDHGKTSLLDRIRRSNVVATEAGGITQVIRAWRVEHEGKWITFLDTPGHQAFTKMRARGAQVTDIAVIVVAADDGVMPQTEEAINHAKAAGVSLVVAINKVDLPNSNIERTKQQLYGLDVLPDNMGGDTPFIETSAATGKGIDELLESLLLVAELKELKANPNRPARGVCLEAMLSEGEGVLATMLVENGTLRKGDVILCGASYGRVRQMYNDHGTSIEEAGPSVPVRITGLDEVPNADDHFHVVPELATAREIAEKRKSKQREASQTQRPALDLMRLGEQPIEKLNVILKADFRGSIEAIRKELEKLKHQEVEVNILHAAIGGISESDVQLALTSPQNTLIVGFNVVPDDRAKSLAEERGISIRQYNVIYMLTDDIRAALEGKLKPRQEVIHLGRAVVRETFKISRVGTIAGCYVTQGVLKRSAKVRLIRDGVIIYPPPDKSAGFDSLKRFKDDASEVREGFECGLKIAGYDDIKVGDVIEAYRIEEVQRTLDS